MDGQPHESAQVVLSVADEFVDAIARIVPQLQALEGIYVRVCV